MFERYTNGDTYAGIWKDPRGLEIEELNDRNASEWPLESDQRSLSYALREGREIWILDPDTAQLVRDVSRSEFTQHELPYGVVWRVNGTHVEK